MDPGRFKSSQFRKGEKLEEVADENWWFRVCEVEKKVRRKSGKAVDRDGLRLTAWWYER
jgi:hypothetical protein